ncbi:uncharacterized protein LOC6561120 [Drosophila grimshawi]|uniref:GH20606 n=1 Tax=Drosophila grimshawi TaxID=7222 RepID=B4J7V2_DROGR|nr:uncharacterized protein LOC6561120 [Drosophila grimshawi]EDW01158.1 GH20606 [Drosophila grimshawi]
MVSSNLEGRLNETNRDYINIDDEREFYTNHYNILRNVIYNELKKEMPLSKWLCGHKLGGSYADNLKIAKPDEFDLLIILKFPVNNLIIVKKDTRKPGNVTLDMTKVLELLQCHPPHKDMYQELKRLVTPENFLLEDKLQSMISGAVTRALSRMSYEINVNGKDARIVYKRCGPAHTMYINEPDIKYSVDFVPAIRLDAEQNILSPEKREYFKDTRYWEAIPKPMKPFEKDNVSFRASYYEAELAMLKNKYRLKDAVRFMKKFRDSHPNMNNLKSYYIKTLFLWQVTKKPDYYWSMGQLKDILIDMFRELKKSLATSNRNGKLPFFWDPQLDLFGSFNQNQRDQMFNCVAKKLYTLERADGNLTDDIDLNVTSSFSTRWDRGAPMINRNLVRGGSRQEEIVEQPLWERVYPMLEEMVEQPLREVGEQPDSSWKCVIA